MKKWENKFTKKITKTDCIEKEKKKRNIPEKKKIYKGTIEKKKKEERLKNMEKNTSTEKKISKAQ